LTSAAVVEDAPLLVSCEHAGTARAASAAATKADQSVRAGDRTVMAVLLHVLNIAFG
jgi:hypothetical protein